MTLVVRLSQSAGVSRLDFLDQHQINFLKDACDPHSSITKEVLRGMKRQFKCGDVEVKGMLCLKSSGLNLDR